MATTGKNRIMAWVVLWVMLTGSSVLLTTGTLAQDDEQNAVRSLPQESACGATITITIQVDPPEGTDSWIVVETLPDSVVFESVDPAHNGAYNEDHHRIDWVSMNGTAAELSYQVTIKELVRAGTELLFEGEHRFHPAMDDRAKTAGPETIVVACEVPEPTGTVTRILPSSAECGTTVQVQLLVEPNEGAKAWVIEENVPTRSTVQDLTTGFEGHHAEGSGQLKWFSLSGGPAVLVYNVTIDEDLDRKGSLDFTGQYGLMPSDAEIQEIQGDKRLPVECGSLTPLLLGGGVAMAVVGAGIFVMRRNGRSEETGDAQGEE